MPPQVEPLILDTLARLESEGFTQSAIEAAVNTIEFSLRCVCVWGGGGGHWYGSWGYVWRCAAVWWCIEGWSLLWTHQVAEL